MLRSVLFCLGLSLSTVAHAALSPGAFGPESNPAVSVTPAFGPLAAVGTLLVARDQLVRFARWRCGPTAVNQLLLMDGGRRLDLPHCYVLDAREHDLVPDIGDPPERRGDWALVLKGVNVQAEIVDDEVVTLGAIGARRTADYGALIIAKGPLGLRNRVLKRGLDLGLALTALVLLSRVRSSSPA